MELWAKWDIHGGWHSLCDHSADVSAVLAALGKLPLIAARFARLSSTRPEDNFLIWEKFAALALLHDVGKSNRGFQARRVATAPRIGHIDELAWVFRSGSRAADDVSDRLVEVLGLERLFPWFNEGETGLFDAVFAHHGRPWAATTDFNPANLPDAAIHWRQQVGDDPVANLAPMKALLDRWFAQALADSRPLPSHPAFEHAFAGLLMLADWLGSNPAPGFFPLANGLEPDRMTFARERAAQVLEATGLDIRPAREAERTVAATFAQAFARPGRDAFTPRPIQTETAAHPAPVLILEAETGAGKTEAALARFAELFRAGAVDGMYFALPTRVAATQIFKRIRDFRNNVFPEGLRPAVVLAVPGQMRVDEAEGARLPDSFDVQWSDDGDRAARWAAEHPKRYLAAPIAVGTIDQVLLGSVRVKHAHLRAVSLLNKLLVVDEVHASDAYMERLLTNLLRFHESAGGHALLLSATLGSAARSRLLGAKSVPSPEAAEAVAYPALTWLENGVEKRRSVGGPGSGKAVTIREAAIMTEPETIAGQALAAARAGAKVLVIRNTVGQAMRVQVALETLGAGPDEALLFRVPHADGRPIATLHHSRFAEPDRRAMDAAVETAIGRDRPSGGCIVVGTQTLEQSLDIDADLLLTDLCPIDVLLQRIGRLHRHAGRTRPPGYERPVAIVLVPGNRKLFQTEMRAYGLGSGPSGGVYEDVRVLELTWRLIQKHSTWTIPAMNRYLVEAATHDAALDAIDAELSAADPAWRTQLDGLWGRYFADLNTAQENLLRFDKPFPAFRIEPDEIIATRLGGADRYVDFLVEGRPLPVGPFGYAVRSLKLPHHMAREIPVDDAPIVVDNLEAQSGITFRLGPAMFSYDRHGLRRIA